MSRTLRVAKGAPHLLKDFSLRKKLCCLRFGEVSGDGQGGKQIEDGDHVIGIIRKTLLVGFII